MCSLPALTFHSIATSHKDSLKARGGISQTLFSMMTAYTQNIGVVCSNNCTLPKSQVQGQSLKKKRQLNTISRFQEISKDFQLHDPQKMEVYKMLE